VRIVSKNISEPYRGSIRHHVAKVNGIRMHHLDAGEGEPVVLLHGFAQTSHMWAARIIPALASKYRVIAPDLRGSGDSEKPPTGYDKKTLAEDVYQLTQHLGFKRIFLVGHDFGANTSYPYAAAHPEQVRRLVFLETLLAGFGYEDVLRHPFVTDGLGRAVWHVGFLDSPYGIAEALIAGRERLLLSWFHQHFAYNPTAVSQEDLDEYTRCFSSPGGLNALKYYSTHYEDAEYNRTLAKTPLKMPVLAFGGAAFLGDGPRNALKQLATDVRGGAIPECGHWIPEERPDFLIAELLKFFAEDDE
jgi:pimeloyl-ACP methyl ester carboxylesterase